MVLDSVGMSMDLWSLSAPYCPGRVSRLEYHSCWVQSSLHGRGKACRFYPNAAIGARRFPKCLSHHLVAACKRREIRTHGRKIALRAVSAAGNGILESVFEWLGRTWIPKTKAVAVKCHLKRNVAFVGLVITAVVSVSWKAEMAGMLQNTHFVAS